MKISKVIEMNLEVRIVHAGIANIMLDDQTISVVKFDKVVGKLDEINHMIVFYLNNEAMLDVRNALLTNRI